MSTSYLWGVAVGVIVGVIIVALIFTYNKKKTGSAVGGDSARLLIGGELYRRVGTPGTQPPDEPAERGSLLGTVTCGEDRMRVWRVSGTDRWIEAEGEDGTMLYERLESLGPDTGEDEP